MGRTIPVINETPSDHHLLSLSLLLTCMAAIIVVSSAMCGTWSRKKGDGIEDGDNEADAAALQPPQDQQEAANDVVTTAATTPIGSEAGEAGNMPLPLPPSAVGAEVTVLDPTKKRKPNIDKSSSLHNYISNKPSRRKLSTGSVSLRMPHGGLSMKHRVRGGGELHHHHHHVHVHNIMRPKQEDSLWTKKILLGEKCKLHLDDEADAMSGGVDDKGKQVDSESMTEIDEEGMSRCDSSTDEYDTTSSLGEKESERSSDVKLDQV